MHLHRDPGDANSIIVEGDIHKISLCVRSTLIDSAREQASFCNAASFALAKVLIVSIVGVDLSL